MASTRVSTVVRGVLVSCVAVSLLATGPRASAAPTFGEVFELLQPNGSLVSVRIWGDEFYGVTETLDGYAVVRDPQTRFFCYAELSADGNDLVSTGVRLGQTVPAGLAPHLRINPAAAMAKIQDARAEFEEIQARTQAARGGLRGPSIGDVAGITLLIDFPEEAGVIPQADVDNYCNQVGYSGNSNNGSIRDYFFDVSGGALTYTNFVTAYYTAANPKSYYTDETIPWGDRGEDLTKEALNALETAGFDFSAYDADSDTKLDALNMFYVGEHGNNWAEGLWPGSIGFNTTWTADGIDVERFQMTNMGGGLTIATFCHENGHMLMGWPDLYDYSDPGPEDSAGVGQFCLMCSAASATNPVQPCGPLKMRVGWTTTHALTTCQKDLTVTAGTNPNEIYKFDNPGNAQEYYILENRQQTGRDTWIPDAGLAIWHVDEAGSNTNQEMTLALHYNVTLVQADGLWHLENNVNSGDTDDLWGAPAYTECTPTTNPKTDWWDDSDSGLVVRSISSPAPTMTFTYCNNLENTPPVARCTASTISKVADTSCCIPVAVGEVDNGSSDDDGASDIDTLCITEVDGASVGCAQSVQVCGYPDGAHTVKLTITDLSGEESSCVANVEVRDETPPVITVFPADQDLQCLAELPAEDTSLVQATDNCTDPNDIIKGVASETNNGGSGCVGDPLIIERVYQATDEAGLSTFRTQTFTVVDDTIPTIDGAITNAVKPIEVDGNCTAYVEFSVTVTDNCCVDPADVVVAAQVLTDNATLGDVEYDPFPPSAPSVTVTGRVLVSDLTCCPATVQLAFDATDCCSNGGAQDTDVVDVIDNYPPIGACGLTHDHPGCNNEGVSILLSGNQPSYWSAATGQPGPDQSVAPWDLLDAGWLPGRPDPDSEESGDRVLRGYVLAWAVNSTGEEIRWNHLKGDAMLINYRNTSALEYNAYAYQATGVDHGQLTGTPGELYMDGVEYDQNYEQLVLDFYASGIEEGFDTDLTLLPLGVDLRQDGDGPVCTKAAFDVWNEEEVGPMRHDRCICCWDQALLSNYDPPGGSIFMRDFLQTDKGVARIDGMESGVCPGSQDVPLLGVVAKHMNVTPDKNNVGRFGMTGMHLPGWGYDSSAVIRADVTPGGGTGEKPSGFVGGSAGQSETTALDGVGRERADGRGGAKTALINPTRVGVSHKGSLLIFPMVEVRWDWCGNLIQDTFIDLTNDYPENVNVQLYFVNGDEPEPAKLPRCIGH